MKTNWRLVYNYTMSVLFIILGGTFMELSLYVGNGFPQWFCVIFGVVMVFIGLLNTIII